MPSSPWIGVGSRPVIGYAPGTQGMADRCAPSRQFSEGIEYEGLVMEGLLQRGYAIAMPDYEGLGTAGVHTYIDRVSQGRATLDAVRGLAASYDIDFAPYLNDAGRAARSCPTSGSARLSSDVVPLHVGGIVPHAAEAQVFWEARFAGLPQLRPSRRRSR